MPEQPDHVQNLDERVKGALGGNIPRYYINGFVASQTSADFVLICEQNNQPVFTLNLSFTTAKTLAQSLATTVAALEERMGRDIMTTHDIDQKMLDAVKR